MVNPKELEAKAARLVELARERDAAFAKERDAEVLLVDGVIRSIQAALPSLCSRIEESQEDGRVRTFITAKAHQFASPKPVRGVLIRDDVDWDTAGTAESDRRFFLLSEPVEDEIPFGNEEPLWWLVQTVEVREPIIGGFTTEKVEYVGTRHVLGLLGRSMRAEQLVEKISSLLDAQLNGDIPKRTKEANARAEKLHALATLMTPPPKKGGK